LWVVLIPGKSRIFKESYFSFFVAGKHEADPQGDPEGDVRQLDPPPTPDHRHVHDDGPTAFRHQLRKYFLRKKCVKLFKKC
jgi:hypothetical protein